MFGCLPQLSFRGIAYDARPNFLSGTPLEHGLDLDEDLKLHDIGVSAFDGSNVVKGELGAFLDAVKKGKVAEGSTLLIESFDRLSRGDLQSAITLMMDLLNSGITIVTLSDGKQFVPGHTRSRRYNAECYDFKSSP